METADTSALLLLDLPDKALAGIDLLSFTTTPRFKGVRNLPKGLHFAFVGASAAFSERHGIWFEVQDIQPGKGPPLFITRWQAATETLEAVTDEAEQLRWRANMGEVWKEGLTPYRQTAPSTTDDEAKEELVDWPKLTSHIDRTLLTRITNGDASHWALSSASSAKRDLEAIPGLSNEDLTLQADKELNFLPIDLKQTWRAGATGRERTEAAQDRSWALHHLTQPSHRHTRNGDNNINESQTLGELQFTFLMLLTLNNFSSLEQWKRLLTLLLTSRAAITTNADLFVSAIRILTLQLQHCKLADNGLIDLSDESGSLLKTLLSRFRKGLESIPSHSVDVQAVVDELEELEEYLHTEHGWIFGGMFAKSGVLELEDGEQVRMDTTVFDEEDETGEYAPQIVELTAEQAKLLNVGGAEGLRHRLSKTSLHEVASSSDEEDEEDGTAQEGSDGESSEAADDLEEMDARY